MRKTILILLLFSALGLQAQTITKDSSYLLKQTINDTIHYQQCRALEYDNGQMTIECGALTDSMTVVKRLFRDAHQIMRPLTRAYKTTAVEFELRSTHNNLSALLDTITGQRYFDFAKTRYGEGFKNQFFRITNTDTDSTFYGEITDILRGREVENHVIDNTDKTYTFSNYKSGGYSRLIRFYDTDHIRMQNLFGELVDLVKIGKIVNEDGIDTGRELWKSPDKKYRLVIFKGLRKI